LRRAGCRKKSEEILGIPENSTPAKSRRQLRPPSEIANHDLAKSLQTKLNCGVNEHYEPD